MTPDPANSIYRESPNARRDFDRKELKRCRMLLRRLRFLEAKAQTQVSGNSGAVWGGFEIESLEWVLTNIGYLVTVEAKT